MGCGTYPGTYTTLAGAEPCASSRSARRRRNPQAPTNERRRLAICTTARLRTSGPAPPPQLALQHGPADTGQFFEHCERVFFRAEVPVDQLHEAGVERQQRLAGAGLLSSDAAKSLVLVLGQHAVSHMPPVLNVV